MCKICTTCESIMNYDPYFAAYVCTKCGRMERKKSKEIQKLMIQQKQRVEAEKQIFGVLE
mgnify:CR=1 FL=1